MKSGELHFHYVSTLHEALRLISQHKKFWVSNCGCREEKDFCGRSRMDLCLFFDTEMEGTGSDFREVDRKFVDGIIEEAKTKHLVPRPFRYDDNKEKTQGICFCCDDCCEYLQDSTLDCNKGTHIEISDLAACIICGSCADVCYFGARKLIEMVPRTSS